MTQHTDLIERLRGPIGAIPPDIQIEAANALEAQAREIAELKTKLAATAKNAFEDMPHDIPLRMKDAICEETGWSGSMVSRMYTELRKAFTGEPYRANEDLDAALLEIEALKAQESELCTLYGLAQAECKKLRKDAERYQFLRDTCWLDTPLEHVICLQMNAKWDRAIDEAIDAAKETKP